MADLYMLPSTGDDLEDIELAEARMPGFTWLFDRDTNRGIGTGDTIEALKQAVYHILNIPRYMYCIYPPRYGSELADLIGTNQDYAISELKRRITEALIQDDRITDVDNWTFEKGKRTVTCSFSVHTIYGGFDWSFQVVL